MNFYGCHIMVLKDVCFACNLLMIRQANGLARKKQIVYFTLREDIGVLKGGLKIKWLINGISAVMLEWLI